MILSGFTPGTYHIPLMIPHNFEVVIQSFGSSGTHAPELTLLDYTGTQVLCQGEQGFKRQGHKAQTLFSFNNAALGGAYMLRIKSFTSSNMRLSITLTNGDFYESPIDAYEDIEYISEASFTNRFYEGTPATIMRYKPSSSGEHSVSIFMSPSECPSVRILIMDPSTTSFYECLTIEGEGSGSAIFNASETYYVVVYIPYDETTDWPVLSPMLEYVDVTVEIS